MELEATDMRLLMRGITKLYEQYLERIQGKIRTVPDRDYDYRVSVQQSGKRRSG